MIGLVSWNVNGIRAGIKSGLAEKLHRLDADIYCIQETKATPEQIDIDLCGQLFGTACGHSYWNSAQKKGYSGTAVFTRVAPQAVTYGIGEAGHDGEGRVITLEFEEYYLVNVYTPNSGRDLSRLDYRMRWEDAFRGYVSTLDKDKPVIICGDMNVAHKEIDLKNPKANKNNAGFTQQERDKMTQLLGAGFTDFYRELYPDKTDAYTWWSYMGGAREKNIGWRIDYFLGSSRLTGEVKDALIYPEIPGSDHCPVGLHICIEKAPGM